MIERASHAQCSAALPSNGCQALPRPVSATNGRVTRPLATSATMSAHGTSARRCGTKIGAPATIDGTRTHASWRPSGDQASARSRSVLGSSQVMRCVASS